MATESITIAEFITALGELPVIVPLVMSAIVGACMAFGYILGLVIDFLIPDRPDRQTLADAMLAERVKRRATKSPGD
jgi:hypothetical protein